MLTFSKDKTISLTRGDVAYLTFPLYNTIIRNNEVFEKKEYDMTEQDKLVFVVAKRANDKDSIVLSLTSEGENTIKISSEDTQDLPIGQYCYVVKLYMNGERFTIIEPSAFKLTGEIPDV